MKTLVLAATLVALAGTAAAQSTQIRPSVQPRAPVIGPIASPALPGAPSANGLASPFPPAVGTLGVPGTSAAGTVGPSDINSGMNVDTSVMGAAGAGAYGTRGMTRTSGPGPISAVDIARSFLGADGNRDGELSRSEAMRLSIMPLSFEEMDANHDDRLTRSEYEDAVR
jgi:hypothetical protein